MADEDAPTGYRPATLHELRWPIASPDRHDIAALHRHLGPVRWA